MRPNYLISLMEFLMLTVFAAPVPAEPVGLLGLFPEASGGELAKAMPEGCTLRRQGTVRGARGDLALPAVDRFALLECSAPLLVSPRGQRDLRGLSADALWIEGTFRERDLDAPAATGRAYVIKLSRYNDADPSRRERELTAINDDVEGRKHAYHNEAILVVERASGDVVPDDVTVLYYDDPSRAKAFRESNGDLLKRIGTFNCDHLVDFVYLNASVDE